MARVVLDADVLIGVLLATDDHHDAALDVVGDRYQDGSQLIVGASVYAECLVYPTRHGVAHLVDEMLSALECELVPVDPAIARTAAALRADHKALRMADALCLATAIDQDAELLTFDRRLAQVDAELRPPR